MLNFFWTGKECVSEAFPAVTEVRVLHLKFNIQHSTFQSSCYFFKEFIFLSSCHFYVGAILHNNTAAISTNVFLNVIEVNQVGVVNAVKMVWLQHVFKILQQFCNHQRLFILEKNLAVIAA